METGGPKSRVAIQQNVQNAILHFIFKEPANFMVMVLLLKLVLYIQSFHRLILC